MIAAAVRQENSGTDRKLDRAVLEEIRALERSGATGLLRRLVGIYLKNSPTQIQALRHGVALNDAKELHNTAHAFKSSSMNLGAAALSALCRKLELGCKSGMIEEAAALIAAIENEYALVEELLLAEIGGGST